MKPLSNRAIWTAILLIAGVVIVLALLSLVTTS